MLANDLLHRDKYSDKDLAKKPKSNVYLWLLTIAKLLKCVGIFIISSLLRTVHVVQLLWLLQTLASVVLVPVQKPFTQQKSLVKRDLVKIVQLAVFGCVIHVLWLYGITLCGPLRSVMVFENHSTVIIAALTVVTKGGANPAKVRGAVVLALGFIVLILADKDITTGHDHESNHAHHGGLNHVFYHLIQLLGIGFTDHKWGVVLLMVALVMNAGFDNAFRKISLEVGGAKRLHALLAVVSAALLTPVALLTYFMSSMSSSSWSSWEVLAASALAAALTLVADFYSDSVCAQHIADAALVARWRLAAMFAGAFGVAYLWFDPNAATVVRPLGDGLEAVAHQHGHYSYGVCFAAACFVFATFALTAPHKPKARAGVFVGMSKTGHPLYAYGHDFLQKTSHSVVAFMRNALKQTLAASDSRRIFYFLCANLAFCSVEFVYGFWTNSLGLISDGFHMFFDCSALVMGLVAAVMTRWSSSRLYTYGYARVEVLSGFINALFLVVIAFFIFVEALERLYDPPEIHTERLLVVSVLGLLVNLFGMFAFSHGGHGHSHGGGGDHGHSHGNANMQGVFLHVMADTLGSVAVIVSTLLIEFFGWFWVDPLCSLGLSVLIFLSVLPLLRDSASVLLQRTPDELEHHFNDALCKVLQLDGVASYSGAHLWELKSDGYVASLHVQITTEANQQRLTHQILGVFASMGVRQTTLQLERDAFQQRITALQPGYELAARVARTPLQHSLMDGFNSRQQASSFGGIQIEPVSNGQITSSNNNNDRKFF